MIDATGDPIFYNPLHLPLNWDCFDLPNTETIVILSAFLDKALMGNIQKKIICFHFTMEQVEEILKIKRSRLNNAIEYLKSELDVLKVSFDTKFIDGFPHRSKCYYFDYEKMRSEQFIDKLLPMNGDRKHDWKCERIRSSFVEFVNKIIGYQNRSKKEIEIELIEDKVQISLNKELTDEQLVNMLRDRGYFVTATKEISL